MARLDNKSTSEPINAFIQANVVGLVGVTGVFDTKDYDSGYTVIITTELAAPETGTIALTIETSDSSGSGFVAVPNSEIIGGDNGVVLDGTLNPKAGTIAVSRGVLSTLRYVQVSIATNALQDSTPLSIIINGRVEVAPPATAEGTSVVVP